MDEAVVYRSVYLTTMFNPLLKGVIGLDYSIYSSLDKIKSVLENEPFFRDEQTEIKNQVQVRIDQARLFWGEYLVWMSQIEFEKDTVERAKMYLDQISAKSLPRKFLQKTYESAEKAFEIGCGNLKGYEECRVLFDDWCKDGVSYSSAQYIPLTWIAIAAIKEKGKIQLRTPRNIAKYPELKEDKIKTEKNGKIRYDAGKYEASAVARNIAKYYEGDNATERYKYGYELIELNAYMETFKIGLTCTPELANLIWDTYFYFKSQLGKMLLVYDERRFLELINAFSGIVYGVKWF